MRKRKRDESGALKGRLLTRSSSGDREVTNGQFPDGYSTMGHARQPRTTSVCRSSAEGQSISHTNDPKYRETSPVVFDTPQLTTVNWCSSICELTTTRHRKGSFSEEGGCVAWLDMGVERFVSADTWALSIFIFSKWKKGTIDS